MSEKTVNRPAASDKKISTSDSFELCYLRHQYFRRAKYNPTEEEMQPYMYIVEHLTKNTFFTYYNLLKSVGMYHEDVLNIGRVHLVSFLGLYAMERMYTKKEDWIVSFNEKNYRKPEAKDYEQKNRANFTLFLKQRMEDLIRVCRQKSRNIKGQTYEEFQIFCSVNKPPKNLHSLLTNYRNLSFKKIDFATFKSIRKKASVDRDATLFQFNGLWYVAISVEQKSLSIDDLECSEYNPSQNTHNLPPDELMENLQIKTYNDPEQKSKSFFTTKEEEDSNCFNRIFNQKSIYRRRIILQKFIAKNKNIGQYQEEVDTAKRMLRNLGRVGSDD